MNATTRHRTDRTRHCWLAGCGNKGPLVLADAGAGRCRATLPPDAGRATPAASDAGRDTDRGRPRPADSDRRPRTSVRADARAGRPTTGWLKPPATPAADRAPRLARCASARCTAPATTSSCSTCATAPPPPDAGAVPRAGRPPYRRGLRPDPHHRTAAQRRRGGAATASGTPTARRAQQCGNGARCVAAWLVRDGAAAGRAFALDSPVGTHAVTRLADDRYAIAMGVPRVRAAARCRCRLSTARRTSTCSTSTASAVALRRGVDGQSARRDRGGRRRQRAGRHARARCCRRMPRFPNRSTSASPRSMRATASACACTSAAPAKRWPAAAAPARRRRC